MKSSGIKTLPFYSMGPNESSIPACNPIVSHLTGISSKMGTFITGIGVQTALKVASVAGLVLPIALDLMTRSYSGEESLFINCSHAPLVSDLGSGTAPLHLVATCVQNVASIVTANIPTCAMGLLALISSQPAVQLTGLPLLTGCLNIPGALGNRLNETFVTTVGGIGNNNGYAAQQSQDGGFIVAGCTDGIGAGGNDVLLTQFAKNGTLDWVKTIGGSGDDQSRSIQRTQDGGFIVGGYTNSSGAGQYDFLLIKLLWNGVVSWAKTLGGISDDYAYSVQQTQEGGFIVAGTTNSFGAVNGDILLSQLDPNGNLSWTAMLGGLNIDEGFSTQQTQDGGYILTGVTTDLITESKDVVLAKFTSIGVLSWVKTLGGASSHNVGNSVQQTPDGGYILVGYTDGFGALGLDVLVAKVTSTGILAWAKVLRGSNHDCGLSSQQTEDGGLIVTGWTKSFGCCPGETSNVFFAKFDSSGNLSLAEIFGGSYTSGSSQGSSIQQTEDGGWIIGGETNFGIVNNDIFLAKLDSHYRIYNCNATESIYPPIVDITSLVTVTTPAFNMTSPSPNISSWNVSSVKQTLNQNRTCSGSTITRTITESLSPTKTSTQNASASGSVDRTQSPSLSFYSSLSSTLSLLNSQTHSLLRTETATQQKGKTRTPQPTPTQPLQSSTAVLIQAFNLTLPGITQMQLSASGSLVLVQTSTGLTFITIDQDDTMTPAGHLVISGTIQATTFSKDEQYVFVSDNKGNIQVIDIQDPYSPQSVGFVSIGIPVQSLMISGGGNELLVGTNTGITVLSAKTPANVNSITAITSYPTSSPVTSIQTNPQTDLIAIGTGRMMTILNFKNETFTNLGQTTFANPVETISPVDQTDPEQLMLRLDTGETVVMNITDPSSATVTSTLPGSSSVLTTLSGSTLLISGLKPGIQIFESSVDNWLTAPEAGYAPVAGPVTSLLFASNGKFGVYSDSEGVKLIKIITDPGRLDIPLPLLLSVIQIGSPIRDVLLNEEGNWIALAGDQLVFIARDNLQHPQLLGLFNTTGSVSRIIFFPDKNTMLFIDNEGMACINCFNPELPLLLGRWNSVKPLYDMALKGSYVYVCQGEEGIAVIDATNPLSMTKLATVPTLGSAQSIRLNQALSRAYIADGSGVAIWSIQEPLAPQCISRFNSTGFVSLVALSLDETMLYFANEQTLTQIQISDPSLPTFLNSLDTGRPIKNIVLSRQGSVIYVADETNGVLIVETKSMQIKGQLPTTSANAIALNELETELYAADLGGGLQVAELITAIPIITLTSRTEFPVGISIEQPLLFFNQELAPVTIDGINSIQYVNGGQKEDLPPWILVDLVQSTLIVTAPQELIGQAIELALSVSVGGEIQESSYQAQVISSLVIDSDKGSVTISTPSPTVSVDVNLTQANFIPQPSGIVSASIQGGLLQTFGPLADINNYLRSVRIIPNPLTLNSFDIATNPAQVEAADMINLLPSSLIVPLRSFLFDQPPVVTTPMNQINIKGLESVDITVPANTFTDPDDPTLKITAQLSQGEPLPSWLTFNPATATFSAYAPVSWLNETLFITITASDGYLSVNNTWPLHIDANKGPFVANPIASLTYPTSVEFTYVIPPKTFQDLDNNTLAYEAVQEGYNVLPGFLSFDSTTQTFLGRPSSNDVNSYRITLSASDKFGASVDTAFAINIQFSNWDYFLYVLSDIAIASAVLTPFTFTYYNRVLIMNMIRQKSYWHNEIPKDLLDRKSYNPRHPKTGQVIEKEEITKIHIMVMDKEKFGYDCAEKYLPLHLFNTLFSKPLLNNEALPTWMELDPDAGTLTLKPDHFPHRQDTFLYQVVGGNGYILESFFLSPSHISMYQSGLLNLRDFVLETGSSVELQPSASPVPAGSVIDLVDVWRHLEEGSTGNAIESAIDIDLEDYLDQPSGDITQPGVIGMGNDIDLEAVLNQKRNYTALRDF